jgi:hypothetical protein
MIGQMIRAFGADDVAWPGSSPENDVFDDCLHDVSPAPTSRMTYSSPQPLHRTDQTNSLFYCFTEKNHFTLPLLALAQSA